MAGTDSYTNPGNMSDSGGILWGASYHMGLSGFGPKLKDRPSNIF